MIISEHHDVLRWRKLDSTTHAVTRAGTCNKGCSETWWDLIFWLKLVLRLASQRNFVTKKKVLRYKTNVPVLDLTKGMY